MYEKINPNIRSSFKFKNFYFFFNLYYKNLYFNKSRMYQKVPNYLENAVKAFNIDKTNDYTQINFHLVEQFVASKKEKEKIIVTDAKDHVLNLLDKNMSTFFNFGKKNNVSIFYKRLLANKKFLNMEKIFMKRYKDTNFKRSDSELFLKNFKYFNKMKILSYLTSMLYNSDFRDKFRVNQLNHMVTLGKARREKRLLLTKMNQVIFDKAHKTLRKEKAKIYKNNESDFLIKSEQAGSLKLPKKKQRNILFDSRLSDKKKMQINSMLEEKKKKLS